MRHRNLIGWLDGIFINNDDAKILLDPVKSSLDNNAIIFISHAHADHTKGFFSNNTKYSTIETKDIFESLTKRRIINLSIISENHPIKIDDIKITAINSGHMLGAVQYFIETPERTILYTGDINCVDTLITQAAKIIKCDILITEATYGNPYYIFPLRDKIYSDIVEWALKSINSNRTPFFHAYSSGKAQEIIKLFNSYTNLPVKVDDKIASVNRVYDHFLSKTLLYQDADDCEYEDPLILLTSSMKNVKNGKFTRAKATGWSVRGGFGGCAYFPLSGHADFRQLINYIRASDAKEVYIYTGFSESLGKYLEKKLNIFSQEIPIIKQRVLTQFY